MVTLTDFIYLLVSVLITLMFAKFLLYFTLRSLYWIFQVDFKVTCAKIAVLLGMLVYFLDHEKMFFEFVYWMHNKIPWGLGPVVITGFALYIVLHELWTIFGLRRGEWNMERDNFTWFGLRPQWLWSTYWRCKNRPHKFYLIPPLGNEVFFPYVESESGSSSSNKESGVRFDPHMDNLTYHNYAHQHGYM